MSTHLQTNNPALNKVHPIEVVLTLESFAGGENTVGEDAILKANEARVIENWECLSVGGMQRIAGINKIADGGATYSDPSDLLIHHAEGSSMELYGIIAGDLVKKSGSDIVQEDAAAFTSGVLSRAISADDTLWITNSTDNLKRKKIGVAIATPADLPDTPCDRIYSHKFRLIAEGSGTYPKRIYGSRAGAGNWTAADAWTLSNDAWSIDLPDDTRGCVMGFPSGDEELAFTQFGSYALYNFPNVAYRPIANGRGCWNADSIAKGDEGVFFFSTYPTLGIFLFDGVNFIELTANNKDVFVDKVDLTKRMFGFYRNKRYYFIYNETGNSVSYTNRMRIYDTRFGRWMSRPINTDLGDNLGYPCLATKSGNEIYAASSRGDKWYEVESMTDDEGYDTQATYETKDFSSRDFEGGQFPIDDIRMKLIKTTISFYGTIGAVTLQWSADRGRISGSQTFNLNADGDLINTTFIVNASNILSSVPNKDITKSFANNAVGKRFNFQILNNGQGTRPIVKRIKIHAILFEED